MIKESELDDDQIKVLTATLDKSCIVSGCAGSGKSVLALIKAQRIQKERGNDYEIIVYTKALCRYMESGRKALGLNNPFYYLHKWKRSWCDKQADYIIVDEIQDLSMRQERIFSSSETMHNPFTMILEEMLHWKISATYFHRTTNRRCGNYIEIIVFPYR